MKDQQLSAWLSLSLIPKLSTKNKQLLLRHFGDAAGVFQADVSQQGQVAKEIRVLLEHCRAQQRTPEHSKKVQQALAWKQNKQHHIITLQDKFYPSLLKEIPDPPLLLYVLGSLDALSLPQIAMVGSRKASPGGRVIAKRLAGDLASGGYSVCSGMALGIDSESHAGALEMQGASVAVLGSGIDQIYPRTNRKLYEELAEKGALISEFALGVPPLPLHFPQRNRIISGLSQGVVVVEAALKSGSLVTARHALEQDREVFAVPGSPHNIQARGCHYLIKHGAKLVENAADIIEELGGFLALEQEQCNNRNNKSKTLSDKAKALLQHIDFEATNIEVLIRQTGISADEAGSLLIELELEGFIIPQQGGYSLAPA
jgi:DNA processing protein